MKSSKAQNQKSKLKHALLCSLFFVLCSSSFAQLSATLRADSNQIQIGDHLKVRLTVKHDKNLKIFFPVITDTLGNLELISASKIDTTAEANATSLTQLYTVSAFDSGEYYAGPVKIFFTNSTGEPDSVFSNDIAVRVNTLDVDTAKPFKPIKAPLEVGYAWTEFLPYIIVGIWLLVVIIGAAYYMWREQQKKKLVPYERPKPKDPAHIWARKELKKLEEEKLWQKDEVKLYYSRLTDILRMYLEYRYGWYAMESTTEEIQSGMNNYYLKEKAKENLLSILRTGDLVKFAKLLPLPDENLRAMDNAYTFIDFTEPNENKEEKK